jgi:thiol-disulfide isomerase/thioredoxin
LAIPRIVVTLLFLLASCSDSVPDIRVVSLDEWDRTIEDYRGEPVLVNVWATWCRTCLDLLPSIAALEQREEYGGVRFLSVVVEDPDDAPALQQAQALLLEQKATFPHYAFQAGVEEALAKLAIENVPAVLVFDAEGVRRYHLEGDEFDNEISPGDVEAAVESLR